MGRDIGMGYDTKERESLREAEAHWRSRVLEAQEHYQHAFAQHQRIIKEFDQALIESAEGSLVIAKARRAMAAALNEVVRTQGVLTDLVLRKKMPCPEDDERLLL